MGRVFDERRLKEAECTIAGRQRREQLQMGMERSPPVKRQTTDNLPEVGS